MKVNISIDDVSPHPFSSTNVLERCEDLIDQFPDIKISLFIPAAYWRTNKSGTTTKESLNLSKYPDFCDTIRELPSENYEIGFHGYYHGIPGISDNDEFKGINYEETSEKIDLMFNEVAKSNLNEKFKKIFRPPAWRMSPDAFRCLSDRGFELFALTDLPHILESYEGSEKSYNCTFSNQYPPFRDLQIEEKNGIVYHACQWDKNYLNTEKMEELIDFLNSCDHKEFVFLEGII